MVAWIPHQTQIDPQMNLATKIIGLQTLIVDFLIENCVSAPYIFASL